MRIVYINLHNINFLVKTYSQIINNYNIVSYKHKFILDAFINRGYEIVNLLLCNKDEVEDEIRKANLVYKENGIDEKIITITNVDEVRSDDLCIVYFHYFNGYLESKKLSCRKILMGNHFIRVKKGQRFNLYEDGFETFVNEAGVESNDFVKTFFNLDRIKNIIMPYTYNDRFCFKKKIEDRSKKVLAIGTLSTVEGIEEYSGYRDFYNTNWVQPQGVKLIKHRHLNKYWMDTEVSYIYQGMLRVNDTDCGLVRTFKKYYNKHHERQGKYMRFNMVDKFNDYTFFVRPEELVGMPSINMIEGMACGCIYFGTMERVYESIGLKPDVHYVKYDGSLSDLRKKHKELLNDRQRIEELSIQGMNYVREMFNPRKVSGDFISKILIDS